MLEVFLLFCVAAMAAVKCRVRCTTCCRCSGGGEAGKDRAERIRMLGAYAKAEGAPCESTPYELNAHSEEVADLFGVSWRTIASPERL
jgi:hypothetical protein